MSNQTRFIKTYNIVRLLKMVPVLIQLSLCSFNTNSRKNICINNKGPTYRKFNLQHLTKIFFKEVLSLQGNIAVVLVLLLALLFGSSFVTVTSKTTVIPKNEVHVTVRANLLDWSITFASNDYTTAKNIVIDKPGYYLLFAEGKAPKGQVTITIYNMSNQIIKEIHGPHLKKSNEIKLGAGQYKIVVKSKNSKHTNYRVYLKAKN